MLNDKRTSQGRMVLDGKCLHERVLQVKRDELKNGYGWLLPASQAKSNHTTKLSRNITHSDDSCTIG